MSDIIHLLPDSVANQIAAGEVIQRPASVVKELVENAIDAGATKITVQAKDSGRTFIQVTDNGKGMSPTDARMAFERHATSKIREANDLFAIRTMGFRGEALASIASVADVELKTRRHDDEVGTFIHISGSELISQEVISCSEGTTFMVKNLFFNVPARRKFLKSNNTELRHIISELQRVALATPEVGFSLYHNGTVVFELPAGNFRKRIVSLFGNSMNQSLVPVQTETSIARIFGFIGQPKFARRTFGEQYFFVNGRYMKHPFFHKAVIQGYEKILPPDLIPSYFICFEVDPGSIDINIHPTKTEIKFESESAVWQMLHAAVREALGKFNVGPSIDFDQEGNPGIPISPKSTDGLVFPSIQYNPNYNPFDSEPASVSYRKSGFSNSDSNLENWKDLYPSPMSDATFDVKPDDEVTQQQFFADTKDSSLAFDDSKKFIQLKNRYILTPVKSGLMVIDQRRAHQRILYEQFLSIMAHHEGVSQQLLFSQTIELNSSDAAILRSMFDDLNTIGFDIREFGPDTFILNGVPGVLGDIDAKGMIETFLEEFKSSVFDIKEKARERLACSLAKASAIEYGYQLSKEAVSCLIDSLFACQSPNYSPTGKPVVDIIPFDEFEKRMK
ncbi:MAG TPA: DNA mismatch repair endonuclease MutL [Prolixibacteraceae bacterium]|nr:DNA mismatch repair endonuclease MutL [Bacteroidales bacterium]HQN93666.1 DNA mismatch repair endonuclease MutL [Prolixibacteraceae bacterium]